MDALLVLVSQILRRSASGPGGENPPGLIDYEVVREPEISGPGAGQPARLRNSVSWVIQVFSGHCFGSSCSVFSS